MAEEFPMWVVGVILVVVGSLGNNLGNNLVSLDHAQKREEVESRKNKEIEEHKENQEEYENIAQNRNDENNVENDEPNRSRNYKPVSIEAQESNADLVNPEDTDAVANTENPPTKKKTSYRITGTVIFILGNLFTFGAFGFGAQSLLASLESIQFVSNLFFVRFVHKEVVTIRMIISTLSIVGGNTMVVIFANHSAVLFNSNGMINLYQTNSAYWGYLVFAFCIFVVTFGGYQYYYKVRLVWKKPLLWRHNFFEPFCYACSAAIVGTQAVLNSKCMAMLIQVAIRGEQNEFAIWYIWMIFATWILMVAFWLNRIDVGLKMYPPLFIIPVMQVFFVFFAIVCGGIYFREFDTFTQTQWIGFTIGVFLILSGVYGLAPPNLVLLTPDEDEAEKELEKKEEVTNNNEIEEEPDLEKGRSMAEEQAIKREIMALEKKLKSLQNSSDPINLSSQVDTNKVRTKPEPSAKISVNSKGTVLVSYEKDNYNDISKPSDREPPIANPIPQYSLNNNSIQGIILPPLNHNESFPETSVESSPTIKKSRKVIKRRPIDEVVINSQP